MPIDWFTVAAQAINFLILVWLLKRFLYQPILNAIDEREKGIAEQFATVEANQADAQKVRDDFQQKTKNFDLERAALMKKAADEAGVERQRLLDEAQNAADSLRTKRQESLQNEHRELSQKISRWTQHEVFAIARKTLADLANASLEERMVDLFVNRVRTLSGEVKEQLTTAIKGSTQSPRVRTAFDLPQPQRNAIESAVKEMLATETQVQFETVPDLVAGIEFSMNGQKVGWSIENYLSMLEKSADELLLEESQPQSKPDTQIKETETDPGELPPGSVAPLTKTPSGAPQ